MRLVFSTMALLDLDLLRASRTMIERGFYIELDYDNVALAGGRHVEDRVIREVREGLGERERRFVKTLHMPYDEIDLDTYPLETIIERSIKWLDLAGDLGVSIAVFHTLKTSSRDPLEANLEFFEKIVREAIDRGVRVAIENRPERGLFGSRPGDLRELVERLGEEAGVCLDVGHANITKSLREFLETLGRRVIELHIHDNDGVRDLHRPPYTGTVDWGLVREWLSRRRDVVPVAEILCRGSVDRCLETIESVRRSLEPL